MLQQVRFIAAALVMKARMRTLPGFYGGVHGGMAGLFFGMPDKMRDDGGAMARVPPCFPAAVQCPEQACAARSCA